MATERCLCARLWESVAIADSVHARMIAKVGSRSPLDDTDRAAIESLPYAMRTVDPGSYLVREGETPDRCPFLVDGFAFRQKLTSEGARQIVSFHVPGDFIDLQNLFLRVSDHNVQTLTRATLGEIPLTRVREIILERPAIAKAMWIDALVDASIFREWIVNVGRRDAQARVAHVLCEFALRLRAAGFAEDYRYEFPMTQEQLGDATGLTHVHVNRVLKLLAENGLIRRNRRNIEIVDWEALMSAGDFNARYLHLDQTRE